MKNSLPATDNSPKGFNVSDFNGMDGRYLYGNETIQYSNLPEVQAAEYLIIYVSPWLLFFGTLGNLVSCVIMHKMSFRVWSTCLYMAVTPVIDLIILYVECGNNWIDRLTRHTVNISHLLMTSSNAVCKVYTFLFNFVLHLSPWLNVAMLGECALSMKFTRATPQLCTREHTRAVVLLITVLLTCVNIQFFWTYGLSEPTLSGHDIIPPFCTYIREWSEFYSSVVWPTINTIIGNVLPLLAIIVLCVIIALTYVRMVVSAKFRQSQTAKNEAMFQHFMDPIAFQEFQGTILGIGFAYLLLMPPKLWIFMYQYVIYVYSNPSHSIKREAQISLLNTLSKILHYVFLSIKFAIYYMSSRRFQREFTTLTQQLCKPFTACTKHQYSVRNSTPAKRKPWKEDEQTVRLVLDGKCHVTHTMENNVGICSQFRSQSITTDV